MLSEYIKALLFIVLAEMGDKTQILAMVFATRFKIRKVLLGICLGSLLNHGIAVGFGKYIGGRIPSYLLQMIAGAAFLLFAIWTLSDDDQEEEVKSNKKQGGAILTVASAFFIGELGDKTQLTAITLSVDALYPILILCGTVSGMLVTSSLGIFVGSKIGDRIPDAIIKIISGTIFMIFGVQKIAVSTPPRYVNSVNIAIFIGLIAACFAMLIRAGIRIKKKDQPSSYGRSAALLYNYVRAMENSVETICNGKDKCITCQGNGCAIGYIRNIIKNLSQSPDLDNEVNSRREIRFYKDKFNKRQLNMALATTLHYLSLNGEDHGHEAHEIRNVLEMMIFDSFLPWDKSIEVYLKRVEEVDYNVGNEIRRNLETYKRTED